MYFAFLQILLSLDFGYVHLKSRRLNTFVRVLTFVQSLLIFGVSSIYFLENTHDPFTFAWIASITIQYLCNSVALVLFGRDRSYCILQKTLMSIDTKLLVESVSYGLDKKVMASCILSSIFKIVIYSYFCYEDHEECVVTVFGALFNMIQLLSNEVVLLTSFFIFYSVNCRLGVLNAFVKNSKQVLYSLDIYKSIVDAIEKPKKYFDYVVSMCCYLYFGILYKIIFLYKVLPIKVPQQW